MTLDGAIEHYEKMADDIHTQAYKDCFFGDIDWPERYRRDEEANEYEQLARWLKELKESKQLRSMQEDLKLIKEILIARGQATETDFKSEEDNV